jgi:hypothetical protein
MVYVLEGTVDQATGQSSYEICNAYRETAKFERWTRPDNSEYLKQIGTGTPTGPFDVCVNTVIQSQQMRAGYAVTTANGSGCHTMTENITWIWDCDAVTATQINYKPTINKLQKKNVETGEIINTTCAFATGTWKVNPTTATCTWAGVGSSSNGTPYDTSESCDQSGVVISAWRWGNKGTSIADTQSLTVPPCPF